MRYLAQTITILLYANMSNPQSDFWNWFQTNEPNFPSTESFDGAFGDELSRRLDGIKSGLVYEISIPKDGPKELVISADGLRELIPSVEQLIQSAPTVEGWKFTAFRPRMDDYAGVKLKFGDREYDPQRLWCYSMVENGHFDLIVYHPDYSDERRDELVSTTYILLDTALGEYDVMTGIRYIDHKQLPEHPEAKGLYPFAELRKVFDTYKENR